MVPECVSSGNYRRKRYRVEQVQGSLRGLFLDKDWDGEEEILLVKFGRLHLDKYRLERLPCQFVNFYRYTLWSLLNLERHTWPRVHLAPPLLDCACGSDRRTQDKQCRRRVINPNPPNDVRTFRSVVTAFLSTQESGSAGKPPPATTLYAPGVAPAREAGPSPSTRVARRQNLFPKLLDVAMREESTEVAMAIQLGKGSQTNQS